MLDAANERTPLRWLQFGSGETRRRHGRQDVFDVVRARNGTPGASILPLPRRHDERQFIFPHERTLGQALLAAEPVHVRLRWRQWRGRGIIRVQHRAVGFRLVLEDARFGAGIFFERVMRSRWSGVRFRKTLTLGRNVSISSN